MHACTWPINFTQQMLCENVAIRVQMMSFDKTKPMQKKNSPNNIFRFSVIAKQWHKSK
jgi:hypothetical protein